MESNDTARRGFDRGRVALVALLLAVFYLAFRIIKPFLHPILLAVILAPLLHPLYAWLKGKLKGREGLAALLTCIIVVLAILGPITLAVIALVGQGIESVQAVQSWVEQGNLNQLLATPWMEKLGPFMKKYLPLVDPQRVDLGALLLAGSQKLGAFLLSKGGAILSGTGLLLGQVLLMLFVLYFLLRDGQSLLAQVLRLSPLRASHQEKLVERIRSVSRSAILGTFATAIAQGIAGAIGLAAVGIPWLFWGTMMAFASLIPVVGTTVIWAPAAIYLLLAGHTVKAILFALYCAIVVGSIDNYLRPVLMKGDTGMSTVYLFFAILGGVQAFGFMGLIYGPVVFGLCAVLLYLYELEFKEFLDEQEHS